MAPTVRELENDVNKVKNLNGEIRNFLVKLEEKIDGLSNTIKPSSNEHVQWEINDLRSHHDERQDHRRSQDRSGHSVEAMVIQPSTKQLDSPQFEKQEPAAWVKTDTSKGSTISRMTKWSPWPLSILAATV
ncbi:hypothetical protein AAC387_Pa02g1620 [Persea americana]